MSRWGRYTQCLFYTPQEKVERILARARWERRETLDDMERMTRIHLAGLFISKVMLACRRYGVTPWSAETNGVNIPELLTEAEVELGIAFDEHQLGAMSQAERRAVKRLSDERRQHAYSSFIRQTSELPNR